VSTKQPNFAGTCESRPHIKPGEEHSKPEQVHARRLVRSPAASQDALDRPPVLRYNGSAGVLRPADMEQKRSSRMSRRSAL
jgi:hypothetical protein